MLAKRIKLRHLEALLAIAQHRHIGRAAQALAISQPALSKTLADFEDILATPLVDRSRSGVVLTPKGQALLGYAGSSLRTLREGIEQVTGIASSESGMIAVGALPTVAAAILPTAVSRFKEHHRSVRVQVHTGPYTYLLARLKRGELDLIAGRQAEPSDMLGLSFEHLYTEPMVLAVRPGHPLLSEQLLDLQELAGYCMVLPIEGTAIRRSTDAFLTRHAIGPLSDVVETVSHSFACAYACNSDAILFTPLGVVEPDLRTGKLVRLPCDTSSTEASVGLTVRTDAPLSHPVSALMAAIREAAAIHRAKDE